MKRSALAAAVAVWLLARAAAAQPWLTGPIPGDLAAARSVVVTGPDEPLFVAPTGEAARRGAAAQGTRLALFAARPGPGCDGAWLMVGALAWVCSSRVEPSPWRALPPVGPRPDADGLPFRYHFAGEYGALGYRDLATAEFGAPDVQLEPGFAVAVVQVRERNPGEEFAFTSKGFWVPMRELGPARPSLFHGEELQGQLDLAWVYTEEARSFSGPGGRRLAGRRARFTVVPILETVTRGARRWHRVGESEWLDGRDLRSPTRPDPMPAVGPAERWIDVDRMQQVLTAFEGDRPVFATLVSTGRGPDGTLESTPAGLHRIWIKLLSSDMDNLEDEGASRLYAIQDVPWVMYFDRGYGLHGTFWHRSFGQVRSHGCVNLAPLDARWLFEWTGPRLPAGWSAVLPTAYDRGTLVHVR